MKPTSFLVLAAMAALPALHAQEAPSLVAERSADPVLAGLQAYQNAHPEGKAAFTWDQEAYRNLKAQELAGLPVGVFDSGVGGLTVLEALFTEDAFDNATLQPGADGKPDLEGERFLYLGDQANMPYGNYPAQGKEDYLRELILKDAVFLLGKRYHVRDGGALGPRWDKPPVKAVVIACNTATAYGLESVREALRRWNLPVPVVGVVEAGVRGLLKEPGEGAVGVMATVGTCASEVYPKTIVRAAGPAGRRPPVVTQWGSARLAGVIEGDPAYPTPLVEQVDADVLALVQAHREKVRTGVAQDLPQPLQTIVLGCTHFALAEAELDAAFERLRAQPDLAPWIAPARTFVNPAEWTARELFQALAQQHLRIPETREDGAAKTARETGHGFFMSVARDGCPGVKLAGPGVLDPVYKSQRRPGAFDVEDTVVVPMTRSLLTEVSRRLVREKLPAVWDRLPGP